MNFEEQLSSVLNDPEAMSKISSIIGALGGGATQQTPSSQPSPPQQPMQQPQFSPPQQQTPPSPNFNLPDLSGDNRTKLLMAVKPFLSEKRAPYVDGAVALLRMMQLGKLGKDMKLF